jgi:hypothetical protein
MVKAMRAAPNHSLHRFRAANSKAHGGAYRRRALDHAGPRHGQGARLMVSGPLFLAFVICQVLSHSAIASCTPLRFFKQCLLCQSLWFHIPRVSGARPFRQKRGSRGTERRIRVQQVFIPQSRMALMSGLSHSPALTPQNTLWRSAWLACSLTTLFHFGGRTMGTIETRARSLLTLALGITGIAAHLVSGRTGDPSAGPDLETVKD